FVPAVLGVALLTLLVWLIWGPEPVLGLAMVSAATVLIIACPCAMGLATPTSITVASGRAAAMGVLFRNGAALQSLGNSRVIALDKAGTLTKGRPELTDLIVMPGFSSDEVLMLAATIEKSSEHPIGDAIVAAAEANGLIPGEPETFEALPGFGIQASVDGRAILIGADRLLANRGIDLRQFSEQA